MISLLLVTGLGMMAYSLWPSGRIDRLQMLTLVRDGRFEAVDSYLDTRRRAVERGTLRDIELHWDFSTFQNSDLALNGQLQEWVKAQPGSANAHAARGHYYLHLGWLSVNGGGSPTTRAAQATRQANNFTLAKTEFDAALAADSTSMTAIAGLMQIAMGSGQKQEIAALYARGREIAPFSPTLHWQYLHALQPQFGGSFAAIRAHQDAIRGQAPDDRLDFLQGFYDYLRGRDACSVGDCVAAIAHLDRALSFGAHPDYFFQRGMTRVTMGDAVQAQADFKQALRLRLHKADFYRGVAHAEQVASNYAKAYDAYTQALALDGGNPDYLEERAYVAMKLDRDAEAARDIEAAQRLGDLDPRLQRSTAQLFVLTEQFKKSMEPAQRAVSLDPNGSRSWLWMAQTYYLNADCKAHEAYARFVELCRIDGQCAAANGMAVSANLRLFNCDYLPRK